MATMVDGVVDVVGVMSPNHNSCLLNPTIKIFVIPLQLPLPSSINLIKTKNQKISQNHYLSQLNVSKKSF